MAWGTWTLGTQTTKVFGTSAVTTATGIRFTGFVAPELDSLLSSPMTAGLVEIKDNRFSAVGAGADFSVLPKWRKVVRQIG